MSCCHNCFEDEYIKEHIVEYGEEGYCDFCKTSSEHCVEPSELKSFFDRLTNLYTSVNELMVSEFERDKIIGDDIWYIIQDNWGIFNDSGNEEAIMQEIYQDDPREGTYYPFMDTPVVDANDYYHENKEVIRKWNDFVNEIQNENRFFPTLECIVELKTVLELSQNEIPKESILYRARISENFLKFEPDQMGMPPKEKTPFGRANPIGIPYLYLASDIKTCISETRPFLGNNITVGTFRAKENIRIVDLDQIYFGSPFELNEEDFHTRLVLFDFIKKLNVELSKPIDRSNNNEAYLEYLPTQYLSEFIKKQNFAGIKFKSSCSDSGYNIALFNQNKIDCVETELYKIDNIQYGFNISSE